MILQLVIMVQRRYYLLLNQRGMADFTFLALGQAGLRAGRLLAGNSDGVMARLGDGLRFGMAGISLAGTGLYASFGAGGFLCHLPVVPVVAKYLRFTLFGFPAFSALMGLYAGFRTGSFLRCFPLPPRMVLGRNGAASPDGGSAILTIKIAGIALFGAGGFLLVYDNRVDVVVGVHLAHFSVVRMVALHILPRPPIPLLPDTVPHLFFFVDAGGFGNGRPTVRLVIMAIGSQHTVIWCVAVCLRRPTPNHHRRGSLVPPPRRLPQSRRPQCWHSDTAAGPDLPQISIVCFSSCKTSFVSVRRTSAGAFGACAP